MGRLEGKVAIVTGAGRAGNIGEAICASFLAEGARAVIATDVTCPDRELLEASMALPDRGAFRLYNHDVACEQGWHELARQVIDEFGQIDVLVNNAGFAIHGGILDTSLEDLRRVMAVNHDGIFLGIKVCAPYLEQARERFPGGGSVINTLSAGSYAANAHNIGYHASKAAGRMTTICAAAELGPKRIRVNSVHPGVTLTPLIRDGIRDYVERGVWDSDDAAAASLAALNPLGTLSDPASIAPLYVYLASEEAREVTGSAFGHDSGFNLRY